MGSISVRLKPSPTSGPPSAANPGAKTVTLPRTMAAASVNLRNIMTSISISLGRWVRACHQPAVGAPTPPALLQMNLVAAALFAFVLLLLFVGPCAFGDGQKNKAC